MRTYIPKTNKPKVVWTPQAKQEEALVRTEDEVLYGGARGGGKTDAGIVWLLYPIWDWLNAIRAKDTEKALKLSRYRALVIRKNADDLKDWIDRANFIYSQTFGSSVQFVGKPVEIKFGTDGPVIRTGHLKDSDAYQKYQGHEYQRMLIEELTQIPDEKNYEDLILSCRSTIDGIDAQTFSTTNPDGPGFYWVKERFGIPEWPPEAPVRTQAMIKLKDGRERLITRVFVSGLLKDNPKLQEKDVGYEFRLANMKDESRRKAWLEGYWGAPIIEGVIFSEELKKLQDEKRLTEISYDPKYPVYTFWDIGRDATPILFMQLIGNTWHLIDFEEQSGRGFDYYAAVLKDKPYWYGQHFGPHDLMKTDMQNETIWQIAEKHGIVFTIVPKATTADGIEAARAKFARLKIDSSKGAPFLKRISAFRREWDDDKQVYRDTYVHDWASHVGTAIFYWGLTVDPIYNAQEGDYTLYNTTFS